MPGDKDRAVFLALGLDDGLRLTFSGQRYYRLANVEQEGSHTGADLLPEEHSLGMAVGDTGSEAELDYRDWLDNCGMNDPLWDEVILPYYEVLVVLPGDSKPRRVRMKVEVLEWRPVGHRVRLEIV